MRLKAFTEKHLQTLLAAIIIPVITLRDADCTTNPGLDSAYRWALNDFLAFHRDYFSSLIYPVGPFCILKWPAAVGDHIIISALFQMFMSGLFFILFNNLYQKFRPGAGAGVPALICCAFFLIVNLDYVFLGCVTAGMLSWKYMGQKIPLYISAVVTVIAFFTKASLFVMESGAWLAFICMVIKDRQLKIIPWIAITALLTYLFIGALIFTSISGFIHYTANNLLLPFSYSDALSLFPDNNWKALAIFWAAIAATGIIFFAKPAGHIIRLLAVCFFLNWKYAIGREDFFHCITFIYLLTLVMVLMLAIQVKDIWKCIFLLLTAVSCFSYNMRIMNSSPQYFWFPSLINFDDRVADYHEFKKKVIAQSAQDCAQDVLPGNWRAEIGNSPIDVFPWDMSAMMVNKLRYKPHPYLQSPPLNSNCEQQDMAFFLSAGAPAYLLWHESSNGAQPMAGLNGDYLLNQMPALTETILSVYAPTRFNNSRFSLFKKRDRPLSVRHTYGDTAQVTWGAWLQAPAAGDSQYAQASVAVPENGLYTLNTIVYKASPVYIEYETNDGHVIRYRFSAGEAKEGMFINPLIQDPALHLIPVKRIRFMNDYAVFFGQRIKVAWRYLSVR